MAQHDTNASETEGNTCPVCKGTGEVSRTVHVGRTRRAVGEQSGLCLKCLGTGEAPTD
jgi:DnaJ-class molecular chaperone